MPQDILIKVEGASKKFCRSLGRAIQYGIHDVSRDLIGLSSNPQQLRKDEFWALNDVSFKLERGQTLGIIGPNGAGKSTLLRLLNGIFLPDKGRIAVTGKVGALIEIGAGFHPLLSGRENIYVNGAILGMSKREINKRFDAIVDFADIGEFIDSPVKFYSSGMFVRLGFAVAIHCEPDILLIDEILAVGDRYFQMKCFQKIYELIKNGVCLILVSHNEYAMREYTKRSIFLKHGKVLFSGNSEDTISAYINDTLSERFGSRTESSGADKVTSEKYRVRAVSFYNSRMERVNKIKSGETLIVDIEYEVDEKVNNPVFGISFYKGKTLVCGFINLYANISLPPICGRGTARLTIDKFLLPIDAYGCAVILCAESIANTLVWQDLPERLVVERPNDTRGLLKLEQKWEIIK